MILRRRTKHPHPPKFLPTSTRHLALTGGIGAGKSAALAAFARHGVPTISSDEIVHGLLRSDPHVLAELRERFGGDVVGEDGADRAKIGAIVFNDRNELDWLETLLHPRVVEANYAWRAELEQRAHPPVLSVTEVPLLYETRGERRFDAVVVVTAPEHVRRERRPVPDDREGRLIPDAEKVARADYAYVNDGTLQELDAFVAEVVAKLSG
ncbi:MAG: dephospho-CoA kinase [Gaiellaceae bacterium]